MKYISMMHLALLFLISYSGCVSVNLGNKADAHKATPKYRSPSRPFESFQAEKSDSAWHNPGNGNSISYFSNCNDNSDPDLEVIRTEMLQGIQELQITQSDNLNYNGRQALRSLARGKVDGVAAKMDILVFKKNGCVYGLSYVGVDASFDSNHDAFNDFVKGFEAP